MSFDDNAPWIKRDIWHKNLKDFYLPYVEQQCDKFNLDPDVYKYYCSPLECDISKTSFKDSAIKEIHQTLLSLISEYSCSMDQFREICLCEKALSNVYAVADITEKKNSDDNIVIDGSILDFDQIVTAVEKGKLQLYARRITTLDVSRGSTDDCSVSAEDFIWCFKRLQVNLDKLIHVVIRITRVCLIHHSFCTIRCSLRTVCRVLILCVNAHLDCTV